MNAFNASGHGPFGAGHIFFLVTRREFMTRVRTRVFVIGTALSVAVLAAYVLFQVFVLDKANTTSTTKVGFTGPAQVLAPALAASAPAYGIDVQVRRVADQAEGESEVRRGGLDVLVNGAPAAPQVLVKDRLSSALAAALNDLVKREALNQQLAAAGLDPATVQARTASARIQVRVLQPGDPRRVQQLIIGLFAAGVLYVALLVYGNFVAQAVVEEKATHIVEILLPTVRPRELLLGKVVGVGLVGLLQMAIIGVAGLVLIAMTHVVAVPTLGAGAIVGGLLWFALGFFLYAMLFAAGGSLVSRQEEVGTVISPITMLIVVGWFIALGVVLPQMDGQPISATGTVLSLLPPFAPIVMPSRMATGEVPSWQVLLAVALALAAAGAMTWLTARMYANSVLRTGARMRLSEALRRR